MSSRQKAPGLKPENFDAWVAEIRRRAWFRAGKHETVQRLRKDDGFARAVVEHAMNILATNRAPYFRDAMNACVRNRPLFERNLREGKGIWCDELEPLVPKERTLLLAKLKKMWDIPERVEQPKQH